MTGTRPKLAVTAHQWRISPVFDVSARIDLFEFSAGRALPAGTLDVSEVTLVQRLALMQSNGVDTLICGAITGYARALLAAAGVEVIPWICGPVDDVLEAYLTNTLGGSDWMMPGCGNQQFRRGLGRHRRGQGRRGANGPGGPAGRRL